jgi:hypothetical protein
MGKPKRTVEEVLANDQRRRTIEDINALIAQPPPYSAQPPSEKDSSSNVGSGTTTLVPTSAFDQLDFTPSPLELPTPAECIAHLKLLHAFAKLRHEVGNKEGLYGISFDLEKYEDAKETLPAADDAAARNDSHQPEGVHGQNSTAPEMSDEAKAAATLAEGIREKRWTVFVSKAVDRFEKWWDTLPPASGYFSLPVRTSHFDASSYEQSPETFPTNGVGLKDRINSLLPPLDVLMVWHSFVLNPRVYLEDCMRLSRHKLWHTPFPWKLINESIDSETFEYSPGDKSSTAFEKSTRLQWYAENDHTNTKVLPCPRCRNSVTVPWTRVPDSPSARTITAYLTEDTGFAGKDFQDFCLKCDLVITHEKLRVAKFINDVEAVHISERPLPGTILSTRGVPQKAENSKHVGTHDPFFPNRIVEKLPEFHYNALREDMARLSIETLKHRFQGVMNTPEKVKTVNSDQYKPDLVAKDSKIAVRKVLSHYWDNSSSFSIDLVGAVIRQGGFIQKMKKIDWLHSPAAITTMQRLIVKYHRFVRIIASNPNKIAVPTLDVDLAWVSPLTSPLYSDDL